MSAMSSSPREHGRQGTAPIRFRWPWSFEAVHEVVQRLSRIHMRQACRQNAQGKAPAGQFVIEQGDRKRMPIECTVWMQSPLKALKADLGALSLGYT